MPRDDADTRIHAGLDASLAEVGALRRIGGVSARHERIDGCAELVATRLRARGFVADLSAAEGGHPVVLAHAEGANLVNVTGPRAARASSPPVGPASTGARCSPRSA
jgi:hypothetical protein